MIEVRDLEFTYGKGTPFEKKALNGINIKIKKGEFIGIIGHTGSGKSTLIQILNGLIKPQSGQVVIDGIDIWKNSKKIRNIRFKVGVVFQYPEHQLFEETVYKDIAFGPGNMGLDKHEIENRVLSAVDFVGLNDKDLYKSPFELSDGQKRKAAIAGVISMLPDVLVLDEPTAGLDPISKDELINKIMEYHTKSGKTVLFVTHNMEDIAKIAQRILILNSGRVEMFDEPKRIFTESHKLEKIGLKPPQVTRIMKKLREKGYNINDSVITIDQALEEIVDFISREKRNA